MVTAIEYKHSRWLYVDLQ